MRTRMFGRFAVAFLVSLCSSSAEGQWVKVTSGSHGISSLVSLGSNIFAGGQNGAGVTISTDNGATWTPENSGLTTDSIYALAVQGANLFAGGYSYGSFGGVCRTDDLGASWSQVDTGLKGQYVEALGANATNVFVSMFGRGVYTSTNSGATWTQVNNGLSDINAGAFQVLGASLFAGTTTGVYVTANNGARWNPTSISGSVSDAFMITGNNFFAGTYAGLNLSTNGGVGWIAVNNGLTDKTIHSLTSSGSDLFAGTFYKGVFHSTDNGANWTAVNTGLIDVNIYALLVSGNYLIAGAATGIWRRPLSEFADVASIKSTTRVLVSNPNPFSERTTINLTLPETGMVQISIVNVLGQEVARLFSGELEAGVHAFNWEPNGSPAGEYFCVVQRNGHISELPLLLSK